MTTTSLLAKFKPTYYFLQLEPEWIEFSFDSPEIKLLEKIVSEEDGNVGIKLLKRNGIHPSEDEAVKEQHTTYLDSAKNYFNAIKNIAEITGLTPSEVTTRTNQGLKENEADILESIAKAKKNNESYLEYSEQLANIRNEIKSENLAIADLLADHTEHYNQVQEAYSNAYDEYYVALIAKFLSGKRSEEKVNFTIDNVRALHSGLRGALANFVTQEINGWERTGKPKP